jgi:WhiB family redox-sensing transcriptional regulator
MMTETPPRGVPLSGPDTTRDATSQPGDGTTSRTRSQRPPTRRRTAFTEPAIPTDGRDWRSIGSCVGDDAELWFSSQPADRHAAQMTCFTQCPVRSTCLAWATETNQRFGIWGGVDFEASESAEGKDGAAPTEPVRLPVLDRVAAVEREYPGIEIDQVAELLGYKDAKSLERTLYRKGSDGKAAVHRLKPGMRSREDIMAKSIPVSGRGLVVDRDHPWFTEAALPPNSVGMNMQHRHKGKVTAA